MDRNLRSQSLPDCTDYENFILWAFDDVRLAKKVVLT